MLYENLHDRRVPLSSIDIPNSKNKNFSSNSTFYNIFITYRSEIGEISCILNNKRLIQLSSYIKIVGDSIITYCIRFGSFWKSQFLSKLIHLSTNEWEEVYQTEYSSEVFNQNRIYNGSFEEFYVREVYFSNLGNEGVIILEESGVKSLISTCSFENSSRNNRGGSIYISHGQSSIQKVCSFGSQAKEIGNFCYVYSPDFSTNINDFLESSITYSNRGDLTNSDTIYLYNLNISILNNNITRNYCKQVSAIATGNGDGTAIMKYSIIDGNSAETRICVALNDIAKYNNIIFTNNTSTKPDKYPGMLYSYGCHLYIENCFIAKNNQNGQYLFGTFNNSNSWGLVFPGSVTVYDSYIDTTENLYKSGQKVNIGPNKDVSIELHLHSTDLCPGAKSIVYIHTENKITDPIHIEFSRFFYLSSLIFFSKLKN